MGMAIYAVLSLRNHGIEGVIDPFSKDERVSGKEITEEMLKGVDCVIDFSSPECAVDNIKAYIDSGVAAVIGTTGWLDRLDEVKAYGEGKDPRIMYSGNYSIGVALFLKLVRKAGELYGKVSAVRGIFEEIDSRISATANYWESDAADKYRTEYKGSEKKVTAMLSAMSEHAKALDLIGAEYTKTEKINVSEVAETLLGNVIE